MNNSWSKIQVISSILHNSWIRRIATIFIVPTLLFLTACPLTGCGNPKVDTTVEGLTGVVYNYSDESISSIRVGGEVLGGPFQSAIPGDVEGGGGQCCISLDPHLATIPVIVHPAEGDDYSVQAKIEQPWPKDANTMIVHILPKRKIVIETTLGVSIAPRSDLLNARLAELGIPKEINADQFMLSGRNTYSEYMDINSTGR